MSFKIYALLGVLLFEGCYAATMYSGPQDGTVSYKCSGDDLILPWTYQLFQGDAISDIQWFYQGKSQELMAIFTHGVFVPQPAFLHRMQLFGNAGFKLMNVSKADIGNYSVEVRGAGPTNAYFQLYRTVALNVADGLMTSDQALHLTTNDSLVLDKASGLYTISLQCGQFMYQQRPSFDVEWLTPSNDVLNSSDYRDGHFVLMLPQPIQEGNYSCLVPAHTACLAQDMQAFTSVDASASRMSILEAQLTQLAADKGLLEAKMAADKAEQQAEIDTLKQQLQTVNASLSRQDAEIASLKTGTTSVAISFQALDLKNDTLETWDTLILPTVITNQGAAYDNSSGVFTAPVNGTYFLAATTGPAEAAQRAGVFLMLDQTVVGVADARGSDNVETGTVHVVLRLGVGQRVCLRAYHSGKYWGGATSFSGFIVSADP